MSSIKDEEKITSLFLFLSVVFITCLLLSNILAAKLLKVGMWSITAGVLVFPISYIINDILTEVYGFGLAKKVIWLGFIMNFFMVGVFALAIILPAPDWYEMSDEFGMILGTTPRITMAGLFAYLSGALMNALIMSKMKLLDEKRFGLRAIVSTIVGESIDSCVFISIAFGGVLPVQQMINMMAVQIVLKSMYECVCLPLTTHIVKKVKLYEEGTYRRMS